MMKSRMVSLVAIFAALNVVCDSLIVPEFSSGVWYGLVFLTVPITGIVLGPYAGFLSTLIGVLVGHTLIPRGVEEYLFTLGAPIGTMVSGLFFRNKWKVVVLYYTVLLTSYLITPVSWQLPIWGMWDIYVAFLVILTIVLLRYRRSRWINRLEKPFLLALCAFVSLEADILFRIFVFIPCQTYRSIYSLQLEVLKVIWVAGAFVTPIKVVISVLVTSILGTRVLKVLDTYLLEQKMS